MKSTVLASLLVSTLFCLCGQFFQSTQNSLGLICPIDGNVRLSDIASLFKSALFLVRKSYCATLIIPYYNIVIIIFFSVKSIQSRTIQTSNCFMKQWMLYKTKFNSTWILVLFLLRTKLTGSDEVSLVVHFFRA